MHSILTYLLLCPLVGIAGFVDAIAGGGGLISLPAYLIAGIPVHNALGTNKLSSTMAPPQPPFATPAAGSSPGSRRCCVSSLPWLAPAWAQSWR